MTPYTERIILTKKILNPTLLKKNNNNNRVIEKNKDLYEIGINE